METLVRFIVWEWVNIALEYAASAWTKLPRFGWAVIGVNLFTHPVFVLLLGVFGSETVFVVSCEAVIFAIEWALLVACYGLKRWRLLALVAFVMNAASYLTGILM